MRVFDRSAAQKGLRSVMLVLLSQAASAQTGPDPYARCSDFKRGTFTYKEAPYDQVRVKRGSRFQTEYDPIQDLRMKFAIRWTGDCAYELTYVKVDRDDYANLIGTKLYVRIEDFPSGNSCRYVCTRSDGQTRFTMIKLK